MKNRASSSPGRRQRAIELLRHHKSWQFSLAGAVGRLPIAMFGLSLVLLVESQYDSYGLAGAATGAFALGTSGGQLVFPRLIDAFGQGRVVLLQLLAFGLTWGTILVVARSAAFPGALVLLAGTAGLLQPGVGTLVRARWASVLDDVVSLRIAYSLEAALDQLIFVAGGPLVLFLAVVAEPSVAVMASYGLLMVGSTGVLLHRASTPTRARRRPGERPPPVAGVGPIVIGLTGIGICFGAADITAVAHADSLGSPGLAALFLLVFAVTGLLATVAHALLAGGGWPRWAVWPIPLVFAGAVGRVDPWVDGAVLAVTGALMAPLLVVAYTSLEQLAQSGRLTQTLALGAASTTAGLSASTAAAGWCVDALGAEHAASIAVLGGVLLVISTARGWPTEAVNPRLGGV